MRTDEEQLIAWLTADLCPVELVEDRLTEALLVRCRVDRIEPPGRIDRIVTAATAAQTRAGKVRVRLSSPNGYAAAYPSRLRIGHRPVSSARLGRSGHAPGEPREFLRAAYAGCYLVSPSLPAGACLAPSSGLVASTIFSANFRWEASSCSVKS